MKNRKIVQSIDIEKIEAQLRKVLPPETLTETNLQPVLESLPTPDEHGDAATPTMLVLQVGTKFVRSLTRNPKVAQSLKAYVSDLRQQLQYESSGPTERLLIDHLILCWLRLYQTELVYIKRSKPYWLNEDWEQRLNWAHMRFVRACHILAKIRRLSTLTGRIPPASRE